MAIGAILGVLALREAIKRGRPRVRETMASRMEKMLATMPEAAPPARMMRDLTAIREQTARILDLLEEGQESRG